MSEKFSPILNSSGKGSLCGCPVSGHNSGCPFHASPNQKASYSSADFDSNYLGKWNPPYISHDEAYLPEREQMVARILDMVRNNGIAAGAVDVWVDHLVGQYTPDPMPSYKCLGWDEEDAMEWASIVLEFINKYLMEEAYLDASGQCNFLELLQLAGRMELLYGEVIASIEWLPQTHGRNSPLQTAFNFIDPGRVRTPQQHKGKVEKGKLKRQVVDGFLQDKFGYCYGAYVFDDLCQDWSLEADEDGFDYVQMKGRNETSHRNLMLHVFRKEAGDQTRGVSRFAPVLEGMKMHAQLKREILLSAQARNKMLGAIKSGRDGASLGNDLGMSQGMGPGGGHSGDSPYSDDNDRRFRGLSPRTKNVAMRMQHHNQMDTARTMGGVKLLQLWEGEELDLIQPNNVTIATTALSKEIHNDSAAGMSIPSNMLQKNYDTGTYSGLRSGRLDFFQAIRAAKPRMDRIANCIVRHAMDEAVAKGLVKFPTKVMRKLKRDGMTPHQYYKQNTSSLMNTRWLGPPEKLIDPNKEILGYYNAERYGYMNAGDIVGKVGGEDYNQFLEKRKRHCKQKIDAQVSCDEYEIRRRIEVNNKLIDEGLIQTEGNTELNTNFNANNANAATDTTNTNTNTNTTDLIKEADEPIVVKKDKNIESPLQDIVQSEDGEPLDTTKFLLGDEDQLVPNRGRPQFSNASKINRLVFEGGTNIIPEPDLKDDSEMLERVAEAVLEKLEPLLTSIADSQAQSNINEE